MSLLAYLVVCVLSIAMALNPGRAVMFDGKLLLAVLGGYTLFTVALRSERFVRWVPSLACVALTASVGYCLIGRLWLGRTEFGFHGNVYKYGTYVGMLAPLAGGMMLLGRRWPERVGGAALILLSALSVGSLGGICAIAAGLMALMVLAPRGGPRGVVMAVTALVAVVVVSAGLMGAMAPLERDLALREPDQPQHLRQRYIEWQALTNLLEARPTVGTGAGCINEHRSEFYYRLPKLNTIGPFDQNGWLATAAEMGVLGLACLVWAVGHYVRLAWSVRSSDAAQGMTAHARLARANGAALVAACVANVFSSLFYNGNLIVFVAILALAARMAALTQGDSDEQQTSSNGHRPGNRDLLPVRGDPVSA